jgi:hypothetical protein
MLKDQNAPIKLYRVALFVRATFLAKLLQVDVEVITYGKQSYQLFTVTGKRWHRKIRGMFPSLKKRFPGRLSLHIGTDVINGL